MIDAYLDHLRVERRLAGHTLESYARDLRALGGLRGGRERAVHAARQDRRSRHSSASSVRAAFRRARSRGRSPPSAASTGISCSTTSLTRAPPTICAPRAHGPRCRSFSRSRTSIALIAQPDVATPLGLRDRAMIELLYATGMRVSELVGVRAADLHLDEHYLTCIGKGNKERLIPMGEHAADWIRRYQRDGRPALAQIRPRRGPRAAPVSERPRRSSEPRRLLENPEDPWPPRGHSRRDQPARAAAFLRHAPARTRRRPRDRFR